ncbi:MAG TPA: 30S ribosomal protein S17 [Pyrinomonadaceae bacterium]|nr:30S ribosomal protein S17 [Pyrinomonadaceae bacterium]
MFRRKKKEEEISTPPSAEAAVTSEAAPAADVSSGSASAGEVVVSEPAAEASVGDAEVSTAPAKASSARARGNRVQKVGIVASDKMQKTVVVRVDRLVLHQRYRRYVRRTSKFKAHDDLGAAVGDRVRIVETRPLSAQKRWRVVEILQKAAK